MLSEFSVDAYEEPHFLKKFIGLVKHERVIARLREERSDHILTLEMRRHISILIFLIKIVSS